MAKPYAYKVINGKEPLLRRLVCEVRYEDGQLYLDRCGRILKKLLQASPEWVVNPNPTPQGTSLFHLVDGLQLSLSTQAVNLDLNKNMTEELIDADEADRFAGRAEEVLAFILDELEITKHSRIGFREWYFFSFDSMADTEQWLRELSLFSVSPALLQSFKAVPEALLVNLVMRGQDCSYRIALNGIERPAQVPVGDTRLSIHSKALHRDQKMALQKTLKKERQQQVNARFAAALDIDAYRIEPTELALSEFIRNARATNLERFRAALAKDNDKKGK